MPGESKTIHVDTALPRDLFERQLKVVSMGDIHAAVAATEISGKLGGGVDFKPLGGN